MAKRTTRRAANKDLEFFDTIEVKVNGVWTECLVDDLHEVSPNEKLLASDEGTTWRRKYPARTDGRVGCGSGCNAEVKSP